MLWVAGQGGAVMPLELIHRVALGQDGMVTTSQALAAGLTRDHIRQLCRSGRWRRLSRGCFAPGGQPPDAVTGRTRIRAAVVSLGPGAFAVLDSALELHGIAVPRRNSAVHVSVPVDRPRPQRPTDPSLVVHQLTVRPDDIVEVSGIPTTSPLRTVTDVILRLDRYPAVSVLDSALNRGLVTPEDLATAPVLVRGRRVPRRPGVISARWTGGPSPPGDLGTTAVCRRRCPARRTAAGGPRRGRPSARHR